MPGAEERPAIIYHYGVGKQRLTLEQMCRYLSEGPAKQYRLYPQKGALLPGSDADIVVWNPQTEWMLLADRQQSAADYCPLEGTRLKGRAEKVYLRGELVAQDGVIQKEKTGIYIRH